ncbi:hypothetical protein D9M69_635040 [compost metagenome]
MFEGFQQSLTDGAWGTGRVFTVTNILMRSPISWRVWRNGSCLSLVVGSSKLQTITSPVNGMREASSQDLSHRVMT